MASITKTNGTFSLTAYRGDCKTLLAFNLDKKSTKNLAGFTIQCQPKGADAYFIQNTLQFEKPADHAQDARLPANASINAPIHKFRWVHVPGSVHQGTKPVLGPYTYTVTPRYFDDNQSLQPLDASRSASVTIEMNTFEKKGVELGFTRGYTQSQAFTHHFGLKAKIQPDDKELVFDTAQESGVNAAGEHFTFAEEYEWLGFTAREKIFALLEEVVKNANLRVDVFAYDLNEPDMITILLKLAKQGRVRVILDNAALHHSASDPKPEDEFEKLFKKVPGGSKLIKRGKFKRYAHDKVFVVRTKATGVAKKVLTGSTNFSVTGLYVNSNHILIFNDPKVAEAYAGVFDDAWDNDVKKGAFLESDFAKKPFQFSSAQTPKTTITFSPHADEFADKILQGLVDRIAKEGKKAAKVGSVLFAVMQIDKGKSVVYDALNTLHKNQDIFSYGISDSPKGTSLFQVGKKTGVLVSGKPGKSTLPAPFDQVRGIGGVGHQVHHKFVVCGFNGPDPVVYCGSSNLAGGGEADNGDNLLAIFDEDIATVFAIEALLLVDHFEFLDRSAAGKDPKTRKTPTSQNQAAVDAHWFLGTTDAWAQKYFDPNDLHFVDRQLFG
jgi:PLD-like domain